jgi:hypothetical protein
MVLKNISRAIVVNDRSSLFIVGIETHLQRFVIVVRADHTTAFLCLASSGRNPIQQYLLVSVKLDDMIEFKTFGIKKVIKCNACDIVHGNPSSTKPRAASAWEVRSITAARTSGSGTSLPLAIVCLTCFPMRVSACAAARNMSPVGMLYSLTMRFACVPTALRSG